MKRKKFIILGLALVAFGFVACDNSQTLQKECVDDIIYLTVFEDLPIGCDSVQIVSPQNSIFKSVMCLDGALSAMLFYYSDGRVVAALSNIETAIARVFVDNKPVSEELKVEAVIKETSLRSYPTVSYVLSISGEVIFTMMENHDGMWEQDIATRNSYLGCVDSTSDRICDKNSFTSITCKLGGVVFAVVAAAIECLF